MDRPPLDGGDCVTGDGEIDPACDPARTGAWGTFGTLKRGRTSGGGCCSGICATYADEEDSAEDAEDGDSGEDGDGGVIPLSFAVGNSVVVGDTSSFLSLGFVLGFFRNAEVAEDDWNGGDTAFWVVGVGSIVVSGVILRGDGGDGSDGTFSVTVPGDSALSCDGVAAIGDGTGGMLAVVADDEDDDVEGVLAWSVCCCCCCCSCSCCSWSCCNCSWYFGFCVGDCCNWGVGGDGETIAPSSSSSFSADCMSVLVSPQDSISGDRCCISIEGSSGFGACWCWW